jgi:hypothetical protein
MNRKTKGASVKLKWLFFIGVVGINTLAAQSGYTFETYQAANVVVGQKCMGEHDGNRGGLSSKSLFWPQAVFIDEKRCYIVDKGNHRVLIYNTVPATFFEPADVVIGQPDMMSNQENSGGLGANTLKTPESAWSDGTRLFIVDGHNHRVLIYNTIPTENNVSADVVIGQSDMQSNASNQGGDVKANTLYFPRAVYSDGTRLFIADYWNHRVLIYNQIPTSNNISADVVIGQPDRMSNAANQGGAAAATTLFFPNSVYSDGIRLYVTDEKNHRVLIYNTIPGANNAPADVVIGQPNMTSNNFNQDGSNYPKENSLYFPYGVHADNSALYIADLHNNRILIYNDIPIVNNASADKVIGQPNFNMNIPNLNGINSKTLYKPVFVFSDNIRLYVADYFNHRMLIYYPEIFMNKIVADHALVDSVVAVHVYGFDFDNNTTLKLIGASESISAKNIVVDDSENISCTFALPLNPAIFNVEIQRGSHRLLRTGSFYALVSTPGLTQWVIQDLGKAGKITSSSVGSLIVDDGDADGKPEIYLANGDSTLFQCKKTTDWIFTSLREVQDTFSEVLICDGDHDGEKEIYSITSIENELVQLKGESWKQRGFTAVDGALHGLCTGDADRNGKSEIYVACEDNDIYQYLFSQGVWSLNCLSVENTSEITAMTIGDGNNDNADELYVADKIGVVHKIEYDGAGWIKNSIGQVSSGDMHAMVVGDGDDDGTTELYGANADGSVYQFKWNGSVWEQSQVNISQTALYDLVISDADNNGTEEIYACSEDGQIYQLSKTTAGWTQKSMGDAGVALRALAVGDGDNDHQFEVYAMGSDQHVYQYKLQVAEPTLTATTTPTFKPTLEPEIPAKVFNSRISPQNKEETVIRFKTMDMGPVTILVYNLRGELITTLVKNVDYSAGEDNEVKWNGKNCRGSDVASGIYIVYIKTRSYEKKLKVAVIK